MTSHDHDRLNPRLDDLLGELARRDRQDQPSSRVEQAVMARWAGTATHSAAPAPSAWRAAGLAFALSAAAAWTFVALIDRPHEAPAPSAPAGAGASPATSSHVPAPGRAPATREGEPVATQGNAAPATRPVTSPVVTSAPMPRGRAGDLTAGTLASSDAFVALSPVAAEDLAAVRMMRVRLPGAAVRTLGLDVPAPAVQQDGFVQADVLLGEDGVARAIRLLP